MDIADQLRVLEDAQGDPAKLVLATVDLAFPAASAAERDALKQTLEACAIPHWCNETILAALLDLSPADSTARFSLLGQLREVERFEARGAGAVNIHESARLALRKRMAREEPDLFRALSGRAADYFAADSTPTGKIEWIYHRLCAEPDAGAAECEMLSAEWEQSAYPQDRDALALALHELEVTGLVDGRARLEVLLYFGGNRYEHREVVHVAECAQTALRLAKETAHARGEATANDLLGLVWLSQGHLPEALAAHRAALDIFRDLAARNPTNALAQWALAVAHGRIGDVYDAQMEFGKALEAFRERSRIFQILVDQEPTNSKLQREAAIDHMRIGDILQKLNQPKLAREAFAAGQQIIQRLVDIRPDNQDWQRDLAMSYGRIASAYDADHVKEKREALNESIRIRSELLSHAPDDARHQRDLAAGYSALAFLEMEQQQLPAAQVTFTESCRILRQLVERDPSNAGWHSGLANACSGLGVVLQLQNELAEAQAAQEEALELRRGLSARDPANLLGQRNVGTSLINLAIVNEARDLKKAAISHYEEASRIYAALMKAAPENAEWKAEQKHSDDKLAELRASLDTVS
jgi:tetratricopeptide (TPR) repeat protein